MLCVQLEELARRIEGSLHFTAGNHEHLLVIWQGYNCIKLPIGVAVVPKSESSGHRSSSRAAARAAAASAAAAAAEQQRQRQPLAAPLLPGRCCPSWPRPGAALARRRARRLAVRRGAVAVHDAGHPREARARRARAARARGAVLGAARAERPRPRRPDDDGALRAAGAAPGRAVGPVPHAAAGCGAGGGPAPLPRLVRGAWRRGERVGGRGGEGFKGQMSGCLWGAGTAGLQQRGAAAGDGAAPAAPRGVPFAWTACVDHLVHPPRAALSTQAHCGPVFT